MLIPNTPPSLFCPMYGFCAKIQRAMIGDSACPSLSQNHTHVLFMDLAVKGEGAYTRLMLSNGITHEEVTVQLHAGALRWSPTTRIWPCGTMVTYETTQAAVADMIATAQQEDTEEAAAVADKIEGHTRTIDADGNVCYEKNVEDCSWKSGTHTIFSEGGKIVRKAPLTAAEVLADGVHTNIQSITVKNGCIVAIDSSQASATTEGTCNNCNSVTACEAGVSQ